MSQPSCSCESVNNSMMITTPTKKRTVLPQEAREVVWNVYSYFKKNLKKGNLLNTVTEATGIPRRTVARIVKEGKLKNSPS